MKILCLLDIEDYKDKNSFPIDFVNSLKNNSDFKSVDFGINWLSEKIPKWDIVHIHWPEDLLKGKFLNFQNINWLNKKLAEWRKYSKITCTIHEHHSHYKNTQLASLLYWSVFSNCDGFIHLGNASVNIFNHFFDNKLSKIPFSVIPHGNYLSIGNPINKENSRKKLGFKKVDNVILVVGKLRYQDEFILMINAFKNIKNENCRLLFIGTLRSSKSYLKELDFKTYFYNLISNFYIKFKLYKSKNIVTRFGFKNNDYLLECISASDIIFIPRIRPLNSGNIPLGFSFSKVVVGSNWGNVGEFLNLYNNPTFEPNATFVEVAQSLLDGLLLAKTKTGEMNKIIADNDWDWSKISNQYYMFYNSLKKISFFRA